MPHALMTFTTSFALLDLFKRIYIIASNLIKSCKKHVTQSFLKNTSEEAIVQLTIENVDKVVDGNVR